MKKNLCRGIIAITVLVLAFMLCEKVLMLKSEDGIEQMKSFYLQEEDTIDVLLIGSSHIYCNVNTGQLWDDFGMSAFNLGGAEQPYWNSYYFIKEALKTQRPKVIVLNATIPGIRFDDYQSEVWLNTNLYGMHWNENRIENTKVSTIPDSFWRIMIPMNSMHGRYSDLKKDDFIDKNYDISYKGFDYRATVIPFDRPDISNVTEATPISEKQEDYLRKIIQLTKDENIPLLLVSVPFVVSEDAQKYYNYEFEIAKEEGVDYLDFNRLYDEVGIDFSTDMAEELHLNISGSQKFTDYLGQYIKDKYNTDDHRGDNKYASWDKDALIHRQEFNGEYLRASENLNQYADFAVNENLLIFVNAKSVSEGDFSLSGEALAKMGISDEKLQTDTALILNGGKVIYSSNEETFSKLIDNGSDRLIFKKDSNGGVQISIDTEDYDMSQNGISFFVYDKVLNEPESYMIFDPGSNTMMKIY